MDKISRRWINEHREELNEKYDGQIVIVCDNQVAKAISEPVSITDIYDIDTTVCKGKEWDYTFICKEEEYLL